MMAYSVFAWPRVLSIILVCVSTLFCNSGKADEEAPQIGTGIFGDDPAEIVAKALLCFNDKSIYSNCEEAYRLTENGNLNVPPEYVNYYCSGPCLSETNLVLTCIDRIMTNFIFYNRATIKDVRDTIKAGCSYGSERGNFDVAQHIQDEGNKAYRTGNQILFGVSFMILGNVLLHYI